MIQLKNEIKSEDFKNELKNIADLKGISIYKLSKISKISYPKLYTYFTNEKNNITIDTFVKLWNALCNC